MANSTAVRPPPPDDPSDGPDLRAAFPAPLDADDPLVQRAMATIGRLSPAQLAETIRTVYRYAYAYARNPHPTLLAEFLNTLLGSVVLHEHPNYARAVTELNELKESTTGEPVDVRELSTRSEASDG